MGTGYPMAESAEEARILELAYGPAQRWVVHIMSRKELDHLCAQHADFLATDIEGMRVVVVTTTNVNLRVELHGDSIRITEQ
jgi:hypothetical protein